MLNAFSYTEEHKMDTVHSGGKTFFVSNMNKIQTYNSTGI